MFLHYDQAGLDAAYDQAVWAPNRDIILAAHAAASGASRDRLGLPLRRAYGPSAVEALDIFRAPVAPAPVAIFIHGGAWRGGVAANFAFPAPLFVTAGIHYVVPDFAWVQDVGGDLRVVTAQVRRAIAWVHANAASFGGDPARLYLLGHSSGAHLAAAALTSDWGTLGAPADIIKGGLLSSGMYELAPVRLSARSRYIAFDDDTVERLSPIRHLGGLTAPLTIAWGSRESPEFIRQGEAFVAALRPAGNAVQALVGDNLNHFEILATLGAADGLLGRAALAAIA